MKQYGLIYSNFEKMRSFIHSKNIDKYNNILVQIFSGIIDKKLIKNIINEMLSVLPNSEIIGATTAGEIFKKRILADSIVISFTIFEKTKIKLKITNNNNNEYELGADIAKELVEKDTKVIILFSDGLISNSFKIIKGIQSENKNIIVCGGKAGRSGHSDKTFVFTKENITDRGAAAVSLSGKQLNVVTDCSLGWSTIGKSMTVTKASDNRIYTIDNINAVDIYKKYLGDEVAKKLPESAVEFPLITVKDSIQHAKVPFACNDDGSLSFFNSLKNSEKVKFGYQNINTLINQSLKMYDRLSQENIEALFIYSCFVRKFCIGEKTNLEINPLNNISSAFGFFTYGEFFTTENSNKFLNAAITVLGLSEGENNSPKKELSLKKRKDFSIKNCYKEEDLSIIKAFTNLIEQSANELQEANKVLKEQKNKIEKLNSITKLILQMNSEMITSGEFDSFIQAILDKTFDVITKGKMGSILLVEDGKLHYKAVKGYALNNDEIKNAAYDIQNIYKYNISNLFSPVIIKNDNDHEFFKLGGYGSFKHILNKKPKEALTCCIGIDENIAGIIIIFNTYDDEDFDEEDKNMLKYICYDMAMALKNISLLKNVLHMSRFDFLTGVHNRNYYKEAINNILNDLKNTKSIFTICGIDLNNFKFINDTYGHDEGDKILIKFAETFKNGIGSNGILGRTGGDEFSAIFPNKGIKDVTQIINRISEELKGTVSFAFGLSEFPNDSNNIDELLKIADRRMYEKKKTMKN